MTDTTKNFVDTKDGSANFTALAFPIDVARILVWEGQTTNHMGEDQKIITVRF